MIEARTDPPYWLDATLAGKWEKDPYEI
jgi:hypothetical protein